MSRTRADFETFLDHMVQSFPNNRRLQRALWLDVVIPFETLSDVPRVSSDGLRLDLVVNDYLLAVPDERILEVAKRTDLLSRIRVYINRMMVMNLIRKAETDQIQCEGMTSLKDRVIELYPQYEEQLTVLQIKLLRVLCQIENEKNRL